MLRSLLLPLALLLPATASAQSSVVALPVAAVRPAAVADSTPARFDKSSYVVGVTYYTALAAGAGGLVGYASGGLTNNSCLGDAPKVAGRSALAFAALGLPFVLWETKKEMDGRPSTSAPRGRWGEHVRRALIATTASAVAGAAIGGIAGSQRPDECYGGAGKGALNGAGRLAVGGVALSVFSIAVDEAFYR